MRKKLLKGFENEYYLCENGDIVDVQTDKVKITHKRGNYPEPRVDLYKDGELVVNVSVIEIILMQFKDIYKCSNIAINYLDGNPENLSLNNIEVHHKSVYVPKVSLIKKPAKTYRFTIDGSYLSNGNTLETIRVLNSDYNKEIQKLKR